MKKTIKMINKNLLDISPINFDKHIFNITLGDDFINDKLGAFHVAHSHSYYEFHFVPEGPLSMDVGNKKVILHSSDFIIIKPHIYHTTLVNNNEHSKRCSFIFSHKDNQDIPEDNKISNHIVGANDYIYGNSKSIYEIIQKIHNEIKENEPYSNKNIQAFFTQIFVEIFRALEKNDKKYNSSYKTLDEKRKYMIDSYFTENYQDPTSSISELSSLVCLSVRQLERNILNIYSCTFREKLTTIRLEQAKNLLLNTGFSIESISEQTGFKNKTYFYRIFKKHTNFTPRQYRNRK